MSHIVVEFPNDNLIFKTMKDALEFLAAFDKAVYANQYNYGDENKIVVYPKGQLTLRTMREKFEFVAPCSKCNSKWNAPGPDGICDRCREKKDEEES